MLKNNKITPDMTIFEVLEKHPKMVEILQDFGLYCATCHLNSFETLKQGVLGHGMDEKTLSQILIALNDVLKDAQGIHLTRLAALKILELAEKENTHPPLLRLKASHKKRIWTYAMDFAKRPQKTDKKLTFKEGVTLLLDPKSYENLKGATIDYVMTYENEGFKINNPNENYLTKTKKFL